MENLDRETMELLGYFFLTIGMVPRIWADNQAETIRVDPQDFRGPFAIWWQHSEPATDVRNFCDNRWGRTDPTGWYLRDDVEETSWSDDNNHRVEIVEDESRDIVDFTVSIDIRTPYSDFVDQIVVLAAAVDCVFFDYEKQTVVEPSREWIIDALQQHEMTHVVFDSTGKLAPN